MRIKFLVHIWLNLREFPRISESLSSYTVWQGEMLSNFSFAALSFLWFFTFSSTSILYMLVQFKGRIGFKAMAEKVMALCLCDFVQRLIFVAIIWAEIFTYFDNLTESDYSVNLFILRMRSVFALLCLQVRTQSYPSQTVSTLYSMHCISICNSERLIVVWQLSRFLVSKGLVLHGSQ